MDWECDDAILYLSVHGRDEIIFNECVDKGVAKMTSKKIFIQRDYSYGTAVRFSTDFPRELSGKVDEATFRQTMEEINAIFEEAEDLSCMTFTEGCLGCLTGYTIHYCFKTHYERSVERVIRYIQQQNREVYEQRGVVFGDPMDRGLRCIELNISKEVESRT